jgi:hypothetical protein
LHNAKLAAVIYLVLSVPMVAIMAVPMMLSGMPGPGIGMLILMPVFYVIFGFIFTAVGAWVYNLIAGKIGGFEYTTSETAE